MAESLRVGVIGLGRVAWLLEDDPLDVKPCTHVGAWLAQPGVVLAAGADPDAARRTAFQARHGVPRVYDDYREMLAREDLDCVSICAYATERLEMVTAVAEAGVRGIWAEKAMACSLAEADAMAQVLARHGTALIVSYLRRWDSRYTRVRELLAEQAIGRLQTINVQFSGNMLHTGTHAFDVLRMLAGEVEEVQAWLDSDDGRSEQSGYRYAGETIADDFGGNAVLRMSDGVMAMIHGRDKRYFRFEFELLGSEGMIRIGNTQQELWQRAPSRHYQGFVELDPVTFPPPAADSCWIEAAADLARAVRGGGATACGVADGRAALAVALAMHESQRQEHRPIRVGEVPAGLWVPSR